MHPAPVFVNQLVKCNTRRYKATRDIERSAVGWANKVHRIAQPVRAVAYAANGRIELFATEPTVHMDRVVTQHCAYAFHALSCRAQAVKLRRVRHVVNALTRRCGAAYSLLQREVLA